EEKKDNMPTRMQTSQNIPRVPEEKKKIRAMTFKEIQEPY
ncbi:11575_t:CDS:2, partial [Dentiscutata heterogama]